MKVINGEVEKAKRAAEKPKTTGLAGRSASRLKDDHFSEEVVAKARTQRRKTIGGIDFELIAASQAGEYKVTVFMDQKTHLKSLWANEPRLIK